MDVVAAVALLVVLGLVAAIAGVESRQGFTARDLWEDLP